MENLNPRKLATLKKQGEVERRRKQEIEEQKQERLNNRRRDNYRTQVTTVISKLEKALKAAAKRGDFRLRFEYGEDTVFDDPRYKAIEDYCKRNKLAYIRGSDHNIQNMGDSAAPCMVDIHSYYVDIRWSQ